MTGGGLGAQPLDVLRITGVIERALRAVGAWPDNARGADRSASDGAHRAGRERAGPREALMAPATQTSFQTRSDYCSMDGAGANKRRSKR